MMSEYSRLMGGKIFESIKLRNCFSISSKDKRFFSSRPNLRPIQPPIQWALGGGSGAGPLEEKWLEREADISSPFGAQIEHERNGTSLAHMPSWCTSDSFTFTF
jgi:hypothetical protein